MLDWHLCQIYYPLETKLLLILTQHACIVNGTESCFFLQQITGRNCIIQVSLTLDCVMSFLRIINIRNTCKCLCHSQKYLRHSSVQWHKVGRT